MDITFHGAAQTVTGSQHLVHVNGQRILLDCGLYQGKRDESRERNLKLPFNPAEVDAMVLSHGHIDHSGNIPNLVKSGYRGKVVCTTATADLCGAMLLDSGHIQEKDAEYVNEKRARQGQPPVEPIYTEDDAKVALEHFVGVEYEKPTSLLPGVTVTFYDAGHMLGSAIVALDIEDREAHKTRRLVFSGDLGRPNVPILRDPVFLDRADLLIMESTYGGKTHPPIQESATELVEIIRRTSARGGKVLVPAFAVERTQMLVYLLNNLYNEGGLPDVPVYVDSPLAVNVTSVFRKHPEDFDAETMQALKKDPDSDVFNFGRLKYLRTVEESKALNTQKGPAVIIAASGMAEAGRIQHHLKNNIENPANTVLIVGFQAPDTLGRRMVEHARSVRIFGEEHQLRAEVVELPGFSGHADHPGLMAWAAAFKQRPSRIFLVHGEPESQTALATSLRGEAGYREVAIPALHESVHIA